MIAFGLIALLALWPQVNETQPEETWHFGQYRLERSYRIQGSSGYRIYKKDELVYSADPAGFGIISVSHGKQINPPEPTVTDITGNVVPELIIEEYPRNPGCCFSYSIFALGATKFREVAHLTGFPSPMTFEDVNHDSIYEITGEDETFVSHYASPRIVLGYKGGEYKLATNLMRHAPPTSAALAARAKKVDPNSLMPDLSMAPDVYSYMLDLIYQGNARSALRFLDLVWPNAKPGKDEFRTQLLTDLEKSPYWAQIRAMNGTALNGAPAINP
jgi:hypothetical protein